MRQTNNATAAADETRGDRHTQRVLPCGVQFKKAMDMSWSMIGWIIIGLIVLVVLLMIIQKSAAPGLSVLDTIPRQ